MSYCFVDLNLFLTCAYKLRVPLNNSSTNDLNSVLSSTLGKHRRHRFECPFECSFGVLSAELWLVGNVLFTVECVLLLCIFLLLHSELLLMLRRLSRNTFLSQFNWLAIDWSSVFLFHSLHYKEKPNNYCASQKTVNTSNVFDFDWSMITVYWPNMVFWVS